MDAFFKTDFRTFDVGSFAIATSQITDVDFLKQCLIVDQRGTNGPGTSFLHHHCDRPTIAVIDRVADAAAAAKAIIRSKFQFGGKSSYAVDAVLVNEWVKDQFLARRRKEIENNTELRCGHNESQQPVQTPDNIDQAEEILVNVKGFTISSFAPG